MLTRAMVSDKDFCTQRIGSVCEQENLGNRKRKCQSLDFLCTSSLVSLSEVFKGVFTVFHCHTHCVYESRKNLTDCDRLATGLVRGILVSLTVTLLHFGPTGHQFNLRIAAQVEPEQSDIKQQASHALVRYQFVFRPNKLSRNCSRTYADIASRCPYGELDATQGWTTKDHGCFVRYFKADQ